MPPSLMLGRPETPMRRMAINRFDAAHKDLSAYSGFWPIGEVTHSGHYLQLLCSFHFSS
jgi:tyrosyl-tRNA synthetase